MQVLTAPPTNIILFHTTFSSFIFELGILYMGLAHAISESSISVVISLLVHEIHISTFPKNSMFLFYFDSFCSQFMLFQMQQNSIKLTCWKFFEHSWWEYITFKKCLPCAYRTIYVLNVGNPDKKKKCHRRVEERK